MPNPNEQPERAVPSPPDGAEDRSLSAALLQAANDVKEVGLGVLAAKVYDSTSKPKDKDK
jgi:hypothetical protein